MLRKNYWAITWKVGGWRKRSHLQQFELYVHSKPLSHRLKGKTAALKSVICTGIRSPVFPMFGIQEECYNWTLVACFSLWFVRPNCFEDRSYSCPRNVLSAFPKWGIGLLDLQFVKMLQESLIRQLNYFYYSKTGAQTTFNHPHMCLWKCDQNVWR